MMSANEGRICSCGAASLAVRRECSYEIVVAEDSKVVNAKSWGYLQHELEALQLPTREVAADDRGHACGTLYRSSFTGPKGKMQRNSSVLRQDGNFILADGTASISSGVLPAQGIAIRVN